MGYTIAPKFLSSPSKRPPQGSLSWASQLCLKEWAYMVKMSCWNPSLWIRKSKKETITILAETPVVSTTVTNIWCFYVINFSQCGLCPHHKYQYPYSASPSSLSWTNLFLLWWFSHTQIQSFVYIPISLTNLNCLRTDILSPPFYIPSGA